jgi:ferrous iron transport protein B
MKELPTITVALAGNPNSGKTSLFNNLVGANQKVGNFSGVTVEKVEGSLTYKDYRIQIVDLPGTYSLTAYSPEEIVARKYIIEKKPHVIVNVLDGTNIERNMSLTTQLLEFKRNVLIAVNMSDEMDRKGIQVDFNQLEKLLGSHIVPTNSRKGQGVEDLLEHIVQVYEGDIILAKNKIVYQKDLEERICELSSLLKKEKDLFDHYRPRWLAIKLFENDEEIYKLVKEKPVWIRAQRLLNDAHDFLLSRYEEDPEVLVAEGRAAFIRGCHKRNSFIS